VAEFMQESIVFLLRVQCRRKESSRSLSHLLMSFSLNTRIHPESNKKYTLLMLSLAMKEFLKSINI